MYQITWNIPWNKTVRIRNGVVMMDGNYPLSILTHGEMYLQFVKAVRGKTREHQKRSVYVPPRPLPIDTKGL